MRRTLLLIGLMMVLLLASCTQNTKQDMCMVKYYNATLHSCAWRITEAGQEIMPLKISPPGTSLFYEAVTGSTHRIEYFVLDGDDLSLGADAVITENMILDSLAVDVHADSSMELLAFRYNNEDGIVLRRSSIGD